MKTHIPLLAAFSAGALFATLNPADAQTWVSTGSPSNTWSAVACSADGLNVVAAAGGLSITGQVYVSTNAGTNWTPTLAPLLRWTSVACSADGTRLSAVANGGGVYASSNLGASWISNNLPAAPSWRSVSSSADGSHLYAVPYGNFVLYHSPNGGALWLTNTTVLADLLSVSTSASGSLVLAADNNGNVQVSTNSGTNWSPNTSLPGGVASRNIDCVNVSGAGHRLTAVMFGGVISSSTNRGVSWFSNSIPPNSSWFAAASSTDGSRLIVVGQKGPVYGSMDSGATWISNSAPALFWQAVASSADGNIIYVAPSNGSIWVRRTKAPPALAVAGSSTGLTLSWSMPSSPLVLQQTPSLDSPNWTAVTNAPTVDLSTLQQQVTIPADGNRAFYRLSLQ